MDQIKDDIEHLATARAHRRFGSSGEKQAADYILGRLKPLVDRAVVMFFKIPLFSSLFPFVFLGEFTVIAALAFWWPAISFIYGLIVFSLYQAESFGFPLVSRYFPGTSSCAVFGDRKHADFKTLLVFTAYLDSCDCWTQRPFFLRISRYFLLLIQFAMVLLLAACALDAFASLHHATYPFTRFFYSAALVFFPLVMAAMLAGGYFNRDTVGANHNASGMAALLHIAEKFREKELHGAALLFFFPGAHHGSRRVMQEVLPTLKVCYDRVLMINLEGVGAGELCYTDSEGVLQQLPCSRDLVEAAVRCAPPYQARKVHLSSRITNAHLPLLQGFNAISILGLDQNNRPVNYAAQQDIVDNISVERVRAAADLAEALARDVIAATTDPMNACAEP